MFHWFINSTKYLQQLGLKKKQKLIWKANAFEWITDYLTVWTVKYDEIPEAHQILQLLIVSVERQSAQNG